jgi:hypothetical protein
MSRALIRLLALSALSGIFLTGCVTPPPVEIVKEAPPVKMPKPQVQRWLRWQESVSTMSPSQLTTALEAAADPGNANQLFYYGLLNQQSDAYDGWVTARDIFRQLNQDEALTTSQRQLAGLLERFNQSRINWFHSRDELRLEYEALQARYTKLQERNTLLEQKIQAITDLEATISIRKQE